MSVGCIGRLTIFNCSLSYSPAPFKRLGTSRIYRRHTNFSLESIEQTFNGQADWNKKVACTISRNGDLIHRVYLRVLLPDVTLSAPATTDHAVGFRWLNWLGHILIKSVEVEIGGQRIDKHYGEWLHIWNELTQTAGHALGYANMVGNTPDLSEVTWIQKSGTAKPNTNAELNSNNQVVIKGKYLYVPLQFWFCTSPGLALPLIALTSGQKSIRSCAFEHCASENTLWSQGLYGQTQMLVA